MKHHSSYLYGKLCESFSGLNAFVEQRRNMVNFLSVGLDRLARLSHDVSDLPYKNRPWRIITKRLWQPGAAQRSSLIFINASPYRVQQCWQWITVADNIVNFSILMQSEKSAADLAHKSNARTIVG